MPRQIKFLGLFCLAALVVLTISAPAGKAPAAIPLRVTLSPVLASTIEPGAFLTCNMLSDYQGVPYEHQSANITLGNRCEINEGIFQMVIGRYNDTARYVKLVFEGDVLTPPDSNYCAPNPYFLKDKVLDLSESNIFHFSTMYLYSEQIIDGKLYLTNTQTYYNLANMKQGDSVIVATWVYFSIADDPATKNYKESSDRYELEYQYPARVRCSDIDGDGKLEWVISPVQEPYYYTNENNKLYPNGSLFRGLYCNGDPKHCCFGIFKFPFELTLDPMK